MWKADPEDIGIDTRSMYISSPQAICVLHIFHTVSLQDATFKRKKILFHSKEFMGLLIYHQEYQTTHIPTGFVSVAISGGFCEN